MNRIRMLALACVAALPLSAGAAGPAPLGFEWNARLRHERVADDAFALDAEATTLRLRAGVRWAAGPRVSAFLEGEAVAAAGDAYNSGTGGRGAYPAVIDPESAEINQAWLRLAAAGVEATVGRQRILLENQRWVGNVGWRQNEQTFDAVSLQGTRGPVALRYAWLDRVHRVASDRAADPLARERRLDGHLLHASWPAGAARVGGYAVVVEDEDVPTASSRTVGLRYVLAPVPATRPLGITVDIARQQDHARNPRDFSHGYWLVEPAWATPRATVRLGWEHLGGDGRHALQTPLATLHAFNGWADRFTVTPAAGLEDRYVSATGRLARGRARGAMEWTVAWHDYRADAGGARYGREFDASLGIPVAAGWRALAKVADYRADGFARDATRLWLQLEWSSPTR